MSDILTRRNAVVGYVALKAASRALERRRRRRQLEWNAWKLVLVLVLGLVSLGVLAGLGAVVLRRQRNARAQDEAVAEEGAEEAASAVAEATPEPMPAT